LNLFSSPVLQVLRQSILWGEKNEWHKSLVTKKKVLALNVMSRASLKPWS
jgi:hypothetical protein